MYLGMKALSEKFGWTPDQIRTMRKVDMNSYVAILDGESEIKRETESKKAQEVTPQERRVMGIG